MKFTFYKYQGTGNDFVMIDNRSLFFPKNNSQLIEEICDRRFGVGADGLILLENDSKYDFKMVYYNSDGRESTMCGNGGRCIVQFAHDLQIIDLETTFQAIDGLHVGKIDNAKVLLQMIEVEQIEKYDETSVFLNTGSPHHVQIVESVNDFSLVDFGKKIRYSDLYAPDGTNVNIVEIVTENNYKVRTYERGVEDETLSCGTGATAVAIAMHYLGKTTSNRLQIQVPGGQLEVAFCPKDNIYTQIYLCGPAQFVFEGVWNL